MREGGVTHRLQTCSNRRSEQVQLTARCAALASARQCTCCRQSSRLLVQPRSSGAAQHSVGVGSNFTPWANWAGPGLGFCPPLHQVRGPCRSIQRSGRGLPHCQGQAGCSQRSEAGGL